MLASIRKAGVERIWWCNDSNCGGKQRLGRGAEGQRRRTGQQTVGGERHEDGDVREHEAQGVLEAQDGGGEESKDEDAHQNQQLHTARNTARRHKQWTR